MPALSERPPLLDADQTSLALQLWQAAAAGDMKGVKDVRAKAPSPAILAWSNPHSPPPPCGAASARSRCPQARRAAPSSTALHMAVMSQRVDIAKYLLAEGADINAKFEPHGDSSFELAERSTSKGGQEVYQLLKVVYEKQLEKKRAELQKAQAAK